LRRRDPDWLRHAAKAMAKAVEQEWKEYQES
jgi:DNA-binding FadR family transcriptional regulator